LNNALASAKLADDFTRFDFLVKIRFAHRFFIPKYNSRYSEKIKAAQEKSGCEGIIYFSKRTGRETENLIIPAEPGKNILFKGLFDPE